MGSQVAPEDAVIKQINQVEEPVEDLDEESDSTDAVEGDSCSIEQRTIHDYNSPRQIRSLVFHLLYAGYAYNYEISVTELISLFNIGFQLDIPQDGEIERMVTGIIEHRQELDVRISKELDNWRLERIGRCTRIILRMALWELEFRQTPPIIVIDEAIELAKCFAESDAYRFVNGVLDQIVKKSAGESPVPAA